MTVSGGRLLPTGLWPGPPLATVPSTSGRTLFEALQRPNNVPELVPVSAAEFVFGDEYVELAPRRRSVLPRYSPGNACYRQDVSPQPDWSLDDLAQELRAIVFKEKSCQSTPPVANRRLAFQDVVDTASFKRKKASFAMSLTEEDMEASDDEGDLPLRLPQAKSPEKPETEKLLERAVRESQISPDRFARVKLLQRSDSVEAALHEVERHRLLIVKEEMRAKAAALSQRLQQEAERETALVQQLEAQAVKRLEQLRSADRADQQAIAQARAKHLSALQRDHVQRTAQDEQDLKNQAAAEAKKKAEQERIRNEHEARARQAEEAARARQEAERQQALATHAQEEEERQMRLQAVAEREAKAKEAEAQKKKREAEAQAQAVGPPTGAPKPRVAEGAATAEAARLGQLQQLKDSIRQFEEDPNLKKERRMLERKVVTLIQQISATQEQVRKKSAEIKALIQQAGQPHQNFLILSLANKLLPQCESQVQKMPSFAFPLAQVVVNVAAELPLAMDILLARLHQECIYTVPKYYVYTAAQFKSEADYFNLLNYQLEEGKPEPTDSYIGRMSGIMTFYAAVCQTSGPGMIQNPHGLSQAWSWCARLLNKLPANRATATALESMLKVVGYRMYQEYPKQFMKLLSTILMDFRAALLATGDHDASAVLNRLETYIQGQRYLQPPEGRNMPVTDESSVLRA